MQEGHVPAAEVHSGVATFKVSDPVMVLSVHIHVAKESMCRSTVAWTSAARLHVDIQISRLISDSDSDRLTQDLAGRLPVAGQVWLQSGLAPSWPVLETGKTGRCSWGLFGGSCRSGEPLENFHQDCDRPCYLAGAPGARSCGKDAPANVGGRRVAMSRGAWLSSARISL